MRALFDVIEKKKKEVQALKKDGQKWTRKADELAEERKKAEEDIERNLQIKKVKTNDQVKKISSFYSVNEDAEAKKHKAYITNLFKGIPDSEIINQLRRHKEPATIFAETREDRIERLYQAQEKENIAKNQQNIFVEAIIGRKNTSPTQYDLSEFDDTLKACNNLPETTKEYRIASWVSTTLNKWEQHILSQREEFLQEGNVAEARRRDAMLAQTKKDLQPLINMLKSQTLEEEILEKMYNVVICCEKKDYQAAHEAYMLLAIGNAAWPMGVTMVGIHERAGRSKIFTSEVAHILNDEKTRKYIQMIKRLLSFAQNQ
ncbi:pre-mRNA splicing factor 18 family protein [Babesia bovis T2Bo]|uniref:pre-mRNA splicing factor 18 family protein n=1 Tax=Babesia bovis T2Bo TaxID=484906 RepID=UPI001D23AD25|nr:pre-mRNA splicing factor 18 family protein [Babesia bovis T2Bo]EDO07478.2 pre-mRNA splicing factor 18 family protein [Babesia bovis T2Bo]